jgi:4,5-dihydroxyphthalate decarboxylase
MKLRTLLGDYPNTRALREGRIRPALAELDFADVKTPNRAFKTVVRELGFDVAELAIMTFLQAKAWGKPLVLVPARVGPARFQHQCLVYNAERGKLRPSDLAGKRVGVRAYAQTTVTWVRGILAEEHGVAPERVRWITFEDGHVAEHRAPPQAERAPAGKEITAMLLAGELDAAIIGNELPDDARVQPLIPDHEAAAKDWARRHNAVPINHMIVVKGSLSSAQPEVVRELYRLLQVARRQAPAEKSEFDMAPYGVEANRSALEVAIDYCARQGMLPRRLSVDELFDATTRAL